MQFEMYNANIKRYFEVSSINCSKQNIRKGDILKNKKMKIARIEKDLSQEQLADLVGATRQTIGMIESGKFNPSLQLCISICRALGKTLDDLFWEEEAGEGDGK